MRRCNMSNFHDCHDCEVVSFAVAISSAFGLGADRNYSEVDNMVVDRNQVMQQ